MAKLEVGQQVIIQSYKHDGSLHRSWLNSTVLEVSDDCMIVYNNKTWVIESDGRKWFTREPAICFFYTNRWYNVISMIRKTGIYYYCNIASPSLYDGEAIKNIDYDLDVKVFPDKTSILLDEDEYISHGARFDYTPDLKDVIEDQLKKLRILITNQSDPFNSQVINHYIEQYDRIHTVKKG
jgi:uncharacterized protein